MVQNIAIIENPPAFSVKYFPLGYPFIGVSTSAKICLTNEGESREMNGYVCGQALVNFEMSLPIVDRYLAIQFHPWSLYSFFEFNALDFYDQQVPLEIVDRYLADQLYELMDSTRTSEEVLKDVQTILLNRFSPLFADNRVIHVLNAVFISKGASKVTELSDSVNLSKRRLEQLFSENIGISPKKYSRIVRFQNLLFNYFMTGEKSFDFPNTFSDQAHFIKEMKNLTGMTPKQLMEHLKDDINKMSALEANLYLRYIKL